MPSVIYTRSANLIFRLESIDQNIQVQFPHPGDDRLPRILFKFDLKGRIFITQFSQRLGQLFLIPAGLWLHPFFFRVPGTDAAKRIANRTNKFAHFGLRLGVAQKLGFSRVSPRWREISYETMLDATRAMAQSDGYYPAWDAFLDKRFDSPIDSTIPITVVFGDKDRALPAKTCQERSLVSAHARWVILENTGHAPMWDSPQEVVAEISRNVLR